MVLTIVPPVQTQASEYGQTPENNNLRYFPAERSLNAEETELKSVTDSELLASILNLFKRSNETEELAARLLKEYGTLATLINNPYPILKEELGLTTSSIDDKDFHYFASISSARLP